MQESAPRLSKCVANKRPDGATDFPLTEAFERSGVGPWDSPSGSRREWHLDAVGC
jgi:hypothetical protein